MKVITIQNNEKTLIDSGWGLNVKENSAKGDGVADDTTFIQTSIDNANKNVILPYGDYQVASITNKYGKEFIGEGRILKSGVLQNSYVDKYQHIFGREYLSAVHKKIMNGQSVNIVFSGDSTTSNGNIADSNFHINNLVSALCTKQGFNTTTVNNGQSGHSCLEWSTTYVSSDLSQNPDVLVLRWGVNDAGLGVDSFVNSLRAGLTTVRNSRPLNSLSIILMSPNSTSDTPNLRDEKWYEAIIPAIRKVARDFQCAFIDTYALFQDSRNAADWMDDPYSDGRHIHPKEVMNLWISSILFDVLFPLSIRLKYGDVGGTPSDATSTIKGIMKLAGDFSGTADLPELKLIDGLVAGTYNNANVTIDAKGRVVGISANIGSDATSIKGTPVDNANEADNRFMMHKNGKIIYVDVNVAGIIGSAGIEQASGSPVTINAGEEKTFTIPSATTVIPSVVEVISGNQFSDTHNNFSSSDKYMQQDSVNGTLVANSSVTLQKSNSVSLIDVTPVMTGNTTVYNSKTYITTSSNIMSNFYAYRAMDGDDSTEFATSTSGGYFRIDFGVGNEQKFTKMSIRSTASAGYAFKNFDIYGMNSDETYTLISSNVMPNNNIFNDFALNGTAYRGFQINFTSAGYGDSVARISGLKLSINGYTTTPYYITTNGSSNFSMSGVEKFVSASIPVTTPTGTSAKYLFSVDNRNTWLYKDETGLHSAGASLSTADWTNYNSNTELETYFNNLTIAQLTTDLTSLGITPASLDFATQLGTTDATKTPVLQPVTINYQAIGYETYPTTGEYDENVRFGIKKVSNTQMYVKNLTSQTRTIKLNVVTSN